MSKLHPNRQELLKMVEEGAQDFKDMSDLRDHWKLLTEKAEKQLEAVRPYARHLEDCNGYPALTEEELARSCSCGFLKAAIGEVKS